MSQSKRGYLKTDAEFLVNGFYLNAPVEAWFKIEDGLPEVEALEVGDIFLVNETGDEFIDVSKTLAPRIKEKFLSEVDKLLIDRSQSFDVKWAEVED